MTISQMTESENIKVLENWPMLIDHMHLNNVISNHFREQRSLLCTSLHAMRRKNAHFVTKIALTCASTEKIRSM